MFSEACETNRVKLCKVVCSVYVEQAGFHLVKVSTAAAFQSKITNSRLDHWVRENFGCEQSPTLRWDMVGSSGIGSEARHAQMRKCVRVCSTCNAHD